ncbi:MAG: methyltransferase domain-containing protein [Chloroflexi bacterium]|nr:methyltransferase domain-containing protein [Chloroflexota bacterium]MBU1661469.1 methyltransferase domain-containing protein [Chloroflexota bacterium]
MNKPPIHLRVIARLMQAFFYLLYHPFAWAYDFVAAVVSIGMWNDWVMSTLPYLKGPRVLELGHGPGHLQAALLAGEIAAHGIDESRQMGRLARRRLRGNSPYSLANGHTQSLPYRSEIFHQIASTFPSEYILDARTLAEAYRVLAPGGALVVLPTIWITGQKWMERIAASLFRVTGQTPEWDAGWLAPFYKAGFQPHIKRITRKSWTLLIIVAHKPLPPA